ncbi:MAG: DUF5397 family protein [Neisseriaceae bacterium]|nr:DUF5397 family protein [Neisseriaceae bacterium]
MQTNAQIPTGSIRTFGEYGVSYVVGEPERQLPNGDWLVNIQVLESGEKTQYKLSKINQDPKAH